MKLAQQAWPETLVIPTGFGKTAAVLAAWLWKLSEGDAGTPRRLVYCLPMRTLVEQTEGVARGWIGAARKHLDLDVELDVLMGGRRKGTRGAPPWITSPERPTVLIGTQDMLVSAALMRGYGTSRYRWPVDFALLHNDALWVFDEVQLAGSAVATSAQLEAFRRGFETGRSSRTLWMSATLDPGWLKTVDFTPADAYRPHDLTDDDLSEASRLWTAEKRLERLDVDATDIQKEANLRKYAAALARAAVDHAKPDSNTVVFVNTVARAQAVYDVLMAGAAHSAKAPDKLLIHSRFRRADRDRLMKRLTEAPPAEGRVVVATQALEAGVDMTSATMITEIAPWSSLVQRFGRCNRYGECEGTGANVFWIDLPDTEAKPYVPDDFERAREVLTGLSECGPSPLAKVPPSPPAPGAVIRRRDLLDLFDTEPDLSGFDVDVSPYVRDADDTDVRLFWRPVDGAPPPGAAAPDALELCPAPIGGARALLKLTRVRAWRWDTLAKEWRVVRRPDVFPGLTIWIDAKSGGYEPNRGFDPSSTSEVNRADQPGQPDVAMDDDPDTEMGDVYVSLVKHTAHVRDQVARLSRLLNLSDDECELLAEAAVWHDLGKAHSGFGAPSLPGTPPLAKWPAADARPRLEGMRRPYFRHELASALALLANRGWTENANLIGYLIAAHHGKVRMRLGALPKEQGPGDGRRFARGVWEGDLLPETDLGGALAPAAVLDLDLMALGEGRCGSSWQARAQGLLKELGPFRLSWLEALIRIADWRASAAEEEARHDDL